MKCSNHTRTEAVGECTHCGRGFCAACTVELDGRAWCRDCLARIVAGTGAHAHPGWRKLAAALLSIVPGAGHMFLGLIGKGFAIMGLLFLSVFLVILYGSATGMDWLIAFLVPALGVLFLSYAVFDSMAIADARRSGREAPAGDDATMQAVLERVLLSRRTMGWLLLIAGGVGLLSLLRDQLQIVYLTALVIPVILLILGILLLLRGRKAK
jgi:hypothetical protein